MPGAVATATVTAVMPAGLFTKFSLQIQRKANVNEYANGETQAGALVGAEKRRWEAARRMTASALVALESFYASQNGMQLPFYVYDTTIPGVTWDSTGVATTGRYSVCFDNPEWSHSVGLGRGDSPFSFTEIA
jgi:hypothetical protein